MDDRFNTIAGWTLFAGIVALGSAIVSTKIFEQEPLEKPGYAIQGVEAEGAAGGEAADPPVAAVLATADAAAGAKLFGKCAACHSIAQGGANMIGPNLYATVGEAIATGKGGYAFSDALKGKGGNWTFDNLYLWLKSPRTFAPGTKMTFAGMSAPQDRANIIAYLNAQGSNVPLPPPPAAGAAAAPAAAANATAPAANAAEPAKK